MGHRYLVEARVVDHVDDMMRTGATVLDRRGEIRAESVGAFATLGVAEAGRLAGVEVSSSNRSFVTD